MADAAHALHRVADGGTPGTLAVTRSDDEGPKVAAGAAAGAATATSARTSAASAPVGGGRDRRRVGPVLVGLLALGIAVVAALFLLDLDGSSPTPEAGSSTSASPGDSSPKQDEGGEDQESSPPASEPSSSPEPTSSPEPSTAPASSEGATAFIREYFDTVPDDTDAGWSMLGPGMRSVGRDSYESWWSSVEDVQVSEIAPAESGETADVTLTYTMQDGRVETERHRLDLLRSENGWLIDGDESI
jgi:hypothetical protein